MISDDISYALMNMGFGPPNLSYSSGYILSSQYYLQPYYYKTTKLSDQLFSAACSCSTRRNFAILGPLPPHPYLPLPGQRCVADADHNRWGEEFWLFSWYYQSDPTQFRTSHLCLLPSAAWTPQWHDHLGFVFFCNCHCCWWTFVVVVADEEVVVGLVEVKISHLPTLLLRSVIDPNQVYDFSVYYDSFS